MKMLMEEMFPTIKSACL